MRSPSISPENASRLQAEGFPPATVSTCAFEQDRTPAGTSGAHADDVRPTFVSGLLADVVEVRCHLLRRRLPRIHGETALPEGALDDLLHRAFLSRNRGDADEILQQPHRVTAPVLDRTADLPHKLGVESPHGYVPLEASR